MKLSDNSISQIVRVLQLALLTGTDITDNMRLMRFVENAGSIDLDPEYFETFEANIKKLEEEASNVSEDG